MRKQLVVPVAALAGLIVGTFVVAPLVAPTATAQPLVGGGNAKGKCVGVSAVQYQTPNGSAITVFRAYEDGTVEANSPNPGDLVQLQTWKKVRE